MNRRSFLERCALLAALGVADPERLLWMPKTMVTVPAAKVIPGLYRYARAQRDLAIGDLVWWKGQVIGAAHFPVNKGNYAFVQALGPNVANIELRWTSVGPTPSDEHSGSGLVSVTAPQPNWDHLKIEPPTRQLSPAPSIIWSNLY